MFKVNLRTNAKKKCVDKRLDYMLKTRCNSEQNWGNMHDYSITQDLHFDKD